MLWLSLPIYYTVHKVFLHILEHSRPTHKLWYTATSWCVLEVDSNLEKQDCNQLYTVFYPTMVLQSVPMCITFIQSCVVLYKVVNQPPILAGAWSLLRISLSYPVMMLAPKEPVYQWDVPNRCF